MNLKYMGWECGNKRVWKHSVAVSWPPNTYVYHIVSDVIISRREGV